MHKKHLHARNINNIFSIIAFKTVREVKNRNSHVREIAFHTLLCIVSIVTIIIINNVKKIHVRKRPTSHMDNYA
jgi:hypothetical protein